MNETIIKFNSIHALKNILQSDSNEIESMISEYSTLVGDKLRQENNTVNNPPIDIRQKLESDKQEKKKKTPKKETNKNWYNLDSILIHNVGGIVGESEIYFKVIEDLQSKLVQIKNTQKTIDELITKGLNEDVSGLMYYTFTEHMRICFNKNRPRKNFEFKSTYTVEAEAKDNLLKVEIT